MTSEAMQRSPARLTMFACALSACTTSTEPGLERSFTLAAGPLALDSESWSEFDPRVLVSLAGSARKPDWPCGLEFSAQYARAEPQDSSVSSGVDFFELRVGAAHTWKPADWLQFVGGIGPRLAFAQGLGSGEFAIFDERAESLGLYAHVGAFVRVHGGFSIGVDGQWADGTDYDFLDEDRDARLTQLLLALRLDF